MQEPQFQITKSTAQVLAELFSRLPNADLNEFLDALVHVYNKTNLPEFEAALAIIANITDEDFFTLRELYI